MICTACEPGPMSSSTNVSCGVHNLKKIQLYYWKHTILPESDENITDETQFQPIFRKTTKITVLVMLRLKVNMKIVYGINHIYWF